MRSFLFFIRKIPIKIITALSKFPQYVKKALKNKLELMDQNSKHPSLRTKKIKGSSDIY